MTNLIKAILEVFGELTFRRFLSLVVIIGVLGCIAILYERMTASFSLGKIEKEIAILSKLDSLRLSSTSDSNTKKMYEAIASQLEKAINSDPFAFRFVASPIVLKMDALWKFLAAATPWLLFGLIAIRDAARKKESPRSVFGGMMIVSIVTGLIGVWIPTRNWPYFNLILYPIISIVAFGVLVGVIVAFVSRKTKKDIQQPPVK